MRPLDVGGKMTIGGDEGKSSVENASSKTIENAANTRTPADDKNVIHNSHEQQSRQ